MSHIKKSCPSPLDSFIPTSRKFLGNIYDLELRLRNLLKNRKMKKNMTALKKG